MAPPASFVWCRTSNPSCQVSPFWVSLVYCERIKANWSIAVQWHVTGHPQQTSPLRVLEPFVSNGSFGLKRATSWSPRTVAWWSGSTSWPRTQSWLPAVAWSVRSLGVIRLHVEAAQVGFFRVTFAATLFANLGSSPLWLKLTFLLQFRQKMKFLTHQLPFWKRETKQRHTSLDKRTSLCILSFFFFFGKRSSTELPKL